MLVAFPIRPRKYGVRRQVDAEVDAAQLAILSSPSIQTVASLRLYLFVFVVLVVIVDRFVVIVVVIFGGMR